MAGRIVAGQRSAVVRPVLEPLAALHRQSHPKADLALLQRAYDVAEAAHATQKRKSGDPYITHPLAVATILAGLGMDTTTLIAALLHDTVEDTGVTLETITTDFGSEVAHLVDGVTKIDKVTFGDEVGDVGAEVELDLLEGVGGVLDGIVGSAATSVVVSMPSSARMVVTASGWVM